MTNNDTKNTYPAAFDMNCQPFELMNTKEMCAYLRIGISTCHDWRSKKSKRYKPDFPKAYYITPRCVRFIRQEVIDWALKQGKELH